MKNFTGLLTILLVTITSAAHATFSVTFSTITNVKCFGGRDGALITSVSGGTSPYTYLWSTGATTANISSLPAGYYAVTVTDNLGATATRNATLTEPTALSFSITPSVYNTSFNISLHGACNGYISSSASGGTSPYTYLWSSGHTTANITNLCASVYTVTLTDANLCTANASQSMTEPDKDSWTMTGNSGSSASTNFIGTTDNRDFVFKTNNSEAFRIKSNGELKASSLSGSGNKVVMVDNDGKFIFYPCWPWSTCGNSLLSNDFIGSTNSAAVVFKTDNTERFRITATGDVKIKNFESTADGLFYNSAGFINKVDFTSSNDVLRGDGTFGALPGGAGYWALTGSNDLYNTNSIGNIYIRGEDRGLIVDDQSNQRIGFMKYSGREAGIWRTTSQDFEIGRVTSGTLTSAGSFTTDLYIDGSGKVGIGTTSPGQKFEVAHNDGSTIDGGMILRNLSSANKNSEIKFFQNSTALWSIGNNVFHGSTGEHNFFIYDNVNGATRFFIDANGKTFIGFSTLPCASCTTALYKLYVEGGISARDVKVTANNFPDYVFNNDYHLMSIYELEHHIKQNKHLPGIPSAKEIENNEGFEVGEMQVKLLKKIEEQALYIIDLQKQIDKLNEKLSEK